MNDYGNYKNITFSELPAEIIGCNFESCTFYNCINTTFTKCNVTNCDFKEPTTFYLSNVCHEEGADIIEGCIFVKSSYFTPEKDILYS